MGLFVNVYKFPNTDCTNGGISSRVHCLCIVNIAGPFDPDDAHPAALLIEHNAVRGYPLIVPAMRRGDQWVAAKGLHMMSGHYGATSDSRFRRAVEFITGGRAFGAVPIHDRIEG